MFFRLRGLCVTVFFLSSCTSGPRPVGDRRVFVPFEYLGSDPASGWIGIALSRIASIETDSLSAPDVREAQSTNAQQVIQGFVTGHPGDLRVNAVIRDEQLQRTVRSIAARGATPIEAATALARQITPAIKPFGTTNNDAIREYFSGRPANAISVDPNFGAAHVANIEKLLLSGQKEELPKALSAARAAKLSDLDLARVQALAGETPKSRSDALWVLARASPHDVSLWNSAAQAALTSKDYKRAIEAFRKGLELVPTNIVFWNTLAYAQTFAGDFEGSKRSIAEYERLQPSDANPVDSLGELNFYEGKFAEAEKLFLQANAMNNAALGGGELYRAALCRYLLGDQAKADDLVRQYLDFRNKHNDPAIAVREAVWLYTSGRKDEARRKIQSNASPVAKIQLAIWDIAEGKRPANVLGDKPELQGWKLLLARRYPEAVEYWKRVYDSNSLVNGNEARVLLAWSLKGAGRAEESAVYLQKWPLPPSGAEPGLSSLWPAKMIELKAGRH